MCSRRILLYRFAVLAVGVSIGASGVGFRVIRAERSQCLAASIVDSTRIVCLDWCVLRFEGKVKVPFAIIPKSVKNLIIFPG